MRGGENSFAHAIELPKEAAMIFRARDTFDDALGLLTPTSNIASHNALRHHTVGSRLASMHAMETYLFL